MGAPNPLPAVKPPHGACASWWDSLGHFDYLHRCVQPLGHEDWCRCECGAKPGKHGASIRCSDGYGEKMRRPDQSVGGRDE